MLNEIEKYNIISFLNWEVGSHTKFSNNIYIQDEDGKYTQVSKKNAIKMADEFIANAKFLRN